MFGHKSNLKIDMADLVGERENLAKFLLVHFKLVSSLSPEGLELESNDVSSHVLAKMVTKFIYGKHLNMTHWVSVSNNLVKINRFNPKKPKKNKHPVTPSIIKHGW